MRDAGGIPWGTGVTDPTIPSFLAALIERGDVGEGPDLEFKASGGGLPKDIWPTVSAFANTRGGRIVLGVHEHEDSFVLDGVRDAPALVQDFYNQVRNQQRISASVCGVQDVTIEPLGSQRFVVIRVPAASRKMRPVYINGNPYSGTYVRRYTGDFRCLKFEMDRMMREASDAAADSTILPHFGWADLDLGTVARYRRRYLTRDPASPWNSYDDEKFLRAISGSRRDRETGDEGITGAGLLMFGTTEALQEWRTRHLIDYRLLPDSDDGTIRWDDRVVWEENLLGAFDSIYPRLTADLPVPFRLEGDTRIDESLVHVVLREALVNLLAHADYAETDALLITRSGKGYRFRNPGSSRVLEADFLFDGRSDPRNPILVRMFRLVGLAEEAGTGIPKIFTSWRTLGYHLPDIDVGRERYEFSLELRHSHLLSDDDRAWLHALGSTWTEAEQLALIVAKHEGDVDNLTSRQLTGQHRADVTKVLGGLRDRGLLQMIGGRRGARYRRGLVATGDLSPSPGRSHGPAREGGTWPSPNGEPSNRAANDASPVHSGMSPVDSGASPVDSGADRRDLNAELEGIARPFRELRRLDPATRDQTLVDLCARRPLSMSELARLTGRTKAHLYRPVRLLVAANRLAYRYPHQPSHPRQEYVATPGRSEGSEPAPGTDASVPDIGRRISRRRRPPPRRR